MSKSKSVQEVSFSSSPARIYQVCSIFTADANALEQQLHQKYAMQRDDRREFFKLSDQQVSEIIKLSVDPRIK